MSNTTQPFGTTRSEQDQFENYSWHIYFKLRRTRLEKPKHKDKALQCKETMSNGQVRPPLSHRTVSYSPVIARKVDHPFIIPKRYDLSPEIERKFGDANGTVVNVFGHHSLPSCGMTKSRTRSQEDLVGCTNTIIGQITAELWYSDDDEMLLIRLERVHLLSTPSPSVVGSNWLSKPECKISILPQCNKFLEAISSKKNCWTIMPNSAVYIGIKKNCLHEKTLRLTCYDAKRKHDRIPIGHAFYPLENLKNFATTYEFVKELKPSSEPTCISTGKIETSVLWISSACKIQINIGNATGLKSPHGILRRQFYVKTSVFVAGEEIQRWKSTTKCANPDVNFDESYILPLTSVQLMETTILIHLYSKSTMKRLSLTGELIGTTIIGPYMSKDPYSLTQWERVVARPLQEITEYQKLYL
eukprot:gene16697-18391_t